MVHQQRHQVDPAGHPGVAAAPQPAGPRIHAAGDRELRDDLAEDQRDQQLAEADDEEAPDHRRTAGGQRVGEQRVDADDGREVGEAEGEVGPRAHLPLELGFEARARADARRRHGGVKDCCITVVGPGGRR